MVGDKVTVWFATYAVNDTGEPGTVYITLGSNAISLLNLSKRLDQGNRELSVKEQTPSTHLHSVLPQCREGGRIEWTITKYMSPSIFFRLLIDIVC